MFCSIVIPTFNTDPSRLSALVASLDAQTIATDRFEVIFVDDGSTSGIVGDLRSIVSTRNTYRLLESENSGWACKPRNDGTRLAQGDFVLYMDHDDVLFPEALQRLENFAAANPADVINPFEIRTNAWSWGWDGFAPDPEKSHHDITRLLPMTPHKLYRRSFLQDHGIAFYEDRRVLWEDVFFNVKVYAHQPRIAVFTEYPVYHWVETGQNTSGTFGESVSEVLSTIWSLFEFFARELEPDAAEALTEHWYRTRVLQRVGSKLLQYEDPEQAPIEIASAKAIAERFVPPRLDALLDPVNQLRSSLVRRGDSQGLWDLVGETNQYAVRQQASGVSWDADSISFNLVTSFSSGTRAMKMRVGNDGHLRSRADRSPAPLTPDSQLTVDFGTHMSGSVRLAVRGVESRETYALGINLPVVAEPGEDGLALPAARGAIRVPLSALVKGRAQPEQRWELGARTAAAGQIANGPLRTDEDIDLLPALIDGRVYILRRSAGGALSVLVERDARSILRSIDGRDIPLHLESRGRSIRLSVGLPGIHVFGPGSFPGYLVMRPLDGAVLAADRHDVILVASVDTTDAPRILSDWSSLEAGDYRVVLRSGDRRIRVGNVTVQRPSASERVRALLGPRR